MGTLRFTDTHWSGLMDSEELPSNVSGHSWELPTDSPLDAAFQIGDQGCCLQPHHCLTTRTQRSGSSGLSQEGLEEGAAVSPQHSVPPEQAIPQDGPGKLPRAETQPPGPALRALSGQCPGRDSASRPRGGGGAGHRTTQDRLPGSLPEHQGWQARPPPARGAASCCLLHLLSGQPGSDTWSDIRCTTGHQAHGPAPLSLQLGQGRKGAPSPSGTVPSTGHLLFPILELPADRKRLVL